MGWKENAIKTLRDSLFPVPTELNEIDWKSGLSCKTERLAQHISAFANQKGGGILVFGVHDDGSLFNISQNESKDIVQKMGNIAKNNLVYSIPMEHSIIIYEGYALLFIYIPEQKDKPVHLRGKDLYASYHRSAGQTVKMSRNQVKAMIALSQGITFENQIAMDRLTKREILSHLNYKAFYKLIDKNLPNSADSIVDKFKDFGLCIESNEGWSITNLGAVLFANDFTEFLNLQGKEVIVRKYEGTNNRQQIFEQHGAYGYAVGFEGLIDFIMRNIIGKEVIDVKREMEFIYPRVAIREFVANALVHQDFGITGLPVTIEIYSNRLTITNAGAPLNDSNRLIDLPPQSRNEELAQTMFLLGICEKRGSGIDRAVEAVEQMYLPAVKFDKSDQHTKVTLYPQKNIREMTKHEKIMACYQHACLMYEDNAAINNQSLRERFGLDKNSSSIASRILSDALETGFIKPADESINSRKYMTYIPYYG